MFPYRIRNRESVSIRLKFSKVGPIPNHRGNVVTIPTYYMVVLIDMSAVTIFTGVIDCVYKEAIVAYGKITCSVVRTYTAIKKQQPFAKLSC